MKAGFGRERIRLSTDDNFMDKVCSDQKDENNECIGFPQLQHSGGFELLRCQSNSRCLTVIDCPWTVKYLKQFLGAQAKIYIRPVQQNLSTTPVRVETTESDHVKEACRNCGQMIPLQSLRSHCLECCEETQSSAYGEESFDFPFEINETPTQYSAPETPTRYSATETSTQYSAPETPTQYLAPETPTQYSAPETPIQYSAPVTSTQYSAPETSTQYSAPGEVSLAVEVNSIVVSSGVTNNETVIETHENIQPQLELQTADVESDVAINLAYDPQTATVGTIIPSAIEHMVNEDITNPVEMLRYLQSVLVTGRKLDIDSTGSTISGETNFINIDRENILDTAFDEVKAITNPRLSLEVEFYGEVSSRWLNKNIGNLLTSADTD